MEDEKNEQKGAVGLGKEIIRVLDDILSTGDWSSSLFLKTSAAKLKSLRDKAGEICGTTKPTQEGEILSKDKNIQPGYIQVFILLYQVDGENLQSWFRAIKSLCEYSANRPAYKEEQHIQEFIRSKVTNIASNGYVIANVKETDMYQEEGRVDSFGHQLFSLNENAIEMENILAFIHANKKRYAVRDKELEFLGEI